MKKILIISLMIITFNVYALDGNDSSPTKSVTTVFTEPVDQYLDVIDFNLLDSSVLFLQFDAPSTAATASPFSIGYGNRFSDSLYLGLNIYVQNPGIEDESTSKLTTTDLVGADFDASNGDSSRIDTLITSDKITKNAMYNVNTTAGLNLSSMSLGLSGSFGYFDHSTEETGLDTETTYGSNNSKTGINEAGDINKYTNNKTLFAGIGAGTTLNVNNLDVEVRGTFGLVHYDNSEKDYKKTYSTLFDDSLSDYAGVSNASKVDIDDDLYTEIYNTLNPSISASTKLPLFQNFDFEAGLGYNFSIDLYNDGGTTDFDRNIDYTSYTDGEFVVTETTTIDDTIKVNIDSMRNEISLPLTFTSNFNDRFTLSVSNVLYYSIETETKETATSKKVTTDKNSTDTFDTTNNTKTVVTTIYETTTTDDVTSTLTNVLSAGAKFYITDKVRINLGSQLHVIPFKFEKSRPTNDGNATTTTETYVSGEMVKTASTTTSNVNNDIVEENHTNFDNTIIEYKAGLTYFVNDNLMLDLQYSDDDDTSSMWEVGNWALLLTAKF